MDKSIRNLLIMGSFLGLGYMGFKAYKTYEAVKGLKYKILGVKLKEDSWLEALAGGFKFVISIAIINTSTESVPFESLFLKVFLNGQFVSDVAIPKGKPVPPKSTIKLNIDFNTSADQLNDILLEELASVVTGGRIDVNLKGHIKTSGVFIPVDETFILNEVKPLENQKILITS